MFNFNYDPQRQGYDTGLWKTLSGTPSVSSNDLLFNADSAIQYADCLRGVYNFKVTFAAAPVNATLTGGTSATSQLDGILTGGTSATSVIETWNAVSDGEFAITIDGTAYDIIGLDFSEAADMDAVAAIIQAGIRAETGSTETVVWSTNKFIITGSKSVTVTSAVDGGSGTDISGVGATTFMDCEDGVGTPTTGWRNVTDGEFAITIDGTAYDITGLDFSSVVDIDDVAGVIQAGIRAKTELNEIVVWSTNKFVITSKTSITVTSAVSEGTGTDISGVGATTFMDSEDGVGTPAAGANKSIGLISLNKDTKALFNIYGNELKCIVKDSSGTETSVIIPWVASWSSAAALFQIKWLAQGVGFYVNGVNVANVNASVTSPMSVYVNNPNSDNLLVSFVEGLGIESYI